MKGCAVWHHTRGTIDLDQSLSQSRLINLERAEPPGKTSARTRTLIDNSLEKPFLLLKMMRPQEQSF
jgi:hypothetical protein